MIYLKKIFLKNFMAFEFAEFEVIQGKVIPIQGENLTDKGQKSNGSGKSALQDALYRICTGNTARKGINDKDLIRKGEKSSTIAAEFYETMNKEVIYIERTIYLKKSETVKCLINGSDQSDSYATVRDFNNFVLDDVLCTTKEDIDLVYIINSEKYKSYFFSSDKEKKDLIARFSGADVINGVDDFVKADIKTFENDIQVIEGDKRFIEGKIESVQSQIDNFSIEEEKQAKIRRIESIEDKIDELHEEAQNLAVEASKYAREHKQVSKLVEEKKNQLKGIDKSIDRSKLESVLGNIKEAGEVSKELETDKQNIKSLLNETLDKKASLENRVRGEIICPNCEFAFVPGKDINVKQVKKDIEKLKVSEEFVRKEIDEINESLSETNEIRKAKKAVNDELSKLDSINNKIERSEQRQEEIKGEVQDLEKRIQSIEKEPIEDKTIELKKSLKSLQKELKGKDKEIQKLQDNMFETKQWIFNFKQFFTYLTNSSLKVIEQETNKYLDGMRSDISIQIEGIKVLADGSTRENITPTILRNGFVEGKFGRMSGGERVRIDAANLIARQEIVNSTHPKGGIDLLFIDEVFDKLDGEGMTNLIYSLSELNKTILITTHITAHINSKPSVLVVKENNKARVELNN